jgi:hypothetical protein
MKLGYLRIIDKIDDNLLYVISDDPVRPEMPKEERINEHSKIIVLCEHGTINPLAVMCVKFLDEIPESFATLLKKPLNKTTAVFYTIWTYYSGAAGELIREAQEYLEKNMPEITRYATFSPKTEMARKFHTKNGATVYRTNEDSVNYLYR